MIEWLAEQRLGSLSATQNCLLALQLLERLDRCSHNVDWVVASQRLGEDIPHAGHFDHGTHSTTSNNTRTRGSWLQEHT
jgi:hypothetical protein